MYIIVTKNSKLALKAEKSNDCVIKLSDEEEKEKNAIISTNLPTEKNMDSQISDLLIKKIGIQANLSGFRYLKFLIKHALQYPGFENEPITKVIYPYCASHFNKTTVQVERAIRHCIEIGYKKSGNKKEYIAIFGNRESAPTNAHFFSTIVLYIRENV